MTSESLFETEQWLRQSPEELFPFFADAKNLERITPPWLNFRILSQSTPQIQEGTLFEYSLRVHRIPVHWKTVILDWSPPYSFVDNQLQGPYRLWHHTHRFERLNGGTLMTDRVRYVLPLGRVGKALGGWWVRRDVSEIFAYRARIISEIFGT